MAEAFAAERVQGGGPIARHPDVARMLAEIRAITLAGRLLALEAGAALDRSRLQDDAGAETRVALLTPIVKAWCTDRGVECASLGIQVHGGMGFTWAFDCHLYYRRAKLLSLALGSARSWKDRLITQLETSNAPM